MRLFSGFNSDTLIYSLPEKSVATFLDLQDGNLNSDDVHFVIAFLFVFL